MSVISLSNQTITIENPSGTMDRHGQKAFGAAVSARCRFERTYKTIMTAERDREPIHAMVGLPPSYTIVRGARVTYEGEQYRVIQVSESPGAGGSIHHRILMLQLWGYV